MARIGAYGDAEQARWRRTSGSAADVPYEMVLTHMGRLLYKITRDGRWRARRGRGSATPGPTNMDQASAQDGETMRLWRRCRPIAPSLKTGPCPIREHTGDGVYVGRCEMLTYSDVCPRHGSLSDYPTNDDREVQPTRRRFPDRSDKR
jgi:hypothetical protein